MPQSEVRIDLSHDPVFAQNLETDLLKELREKSPQGVNTSFSLRLFDDDGNALGGLTASTSYGWLLIKVLYIERSARRCGHGASLLDAAMKHAKTLGCHSAWLDTSDRNARHFYIAYGFDDFGMLTNSKSETPSEHVRWFLKAKI